MVSTSEKEENDVLRLYSSVCLNPIIDVVVSKLRQNSMLRSG
jgi:hypothetical protein